MTACTLFPPSLCSLMGKRRELICDWFFASTALSNEFLTSSLAHDTNVPGVLVPLMAKVTYQGQFYLAVSRCDSFSLGGGRWRYYFVIFCYVSIVCLTVGPCNRAPITSLMCRFSLRERVFHPEALKLLDTLGSCWYLGQNRVCFV